MSTDERVIVDDTAVRQMATRQLAADITRSPVFASLRARPSGPTPWISRTQWAADLAAAALREWIGASGLPWVQTGDPVPHVPFEALFAAESAPHRQVATALYLWAMRHHGVIAGRRLVELIATPAGEELVRRATAPEHLAHLATLDHEAQVVAAGAILGAVHWLAWPMVAETSERLAASLPAFARAPLPPAQSRSATGFVLPFRFDPSLVRTFLEPMIAAAIHEAMRAGDVHVLGYAWSASRSAALAIPGTNELTAAAFAAGIGRLAPAERALLTDALLRALPLLSRAIGPFVEQPLKSLYAASHPEAPPP